MSTNETSDSLGAIGDRPVVNPVVDETQNGVSLETNHDTDTLGAHGDQPETTPTVDGTQHGVPRESSQLSESLMQIPSILPEDTVELQTWDNAVNAESLALIDRIRTMSARAFEHYPQSWAHFVAIDGSRRVPKTLLQDHPEGMIAKLDSKKRLKELLAMVHSAELWLKSLTTVSGAGRILPGFLTPFREGVERILTSSIANIDTEEASLVIDDLTTKIRKFRFPVEVQNL